jgi:hypothetical protein
MCPTNVNASSAGTIPFWKMIQYFSERKLHCCNAHLLFSSLKKHCLCHGAVYSENGLGQGARKRILGLLFRAQQQAARVYSSSAFETRLLGNHVPQNDMFHRRFRSQVSSSEQMSLIKQLRERTSAPIKDVKASLVSCDWDIG